MADKTETALVNPQDIPFPALRGMDDDDGQEESPLASLLGASDTIEREMMPQTKFPTGGTPYWNFEDGSQPVPEVGGVIVHQHDRRTFFAPGSDSGERPLCISVDGETGYARSPEVVEKYGITSDCTTCPMAQFGTAVNKSGELTGGQACTLRKDTYVATSQHYIPLLVSFPSTSWRVVKKFLVGQAALGRHFWTYEASFTLESSKNKSGDEYAIAKPAFVKALSGVTLEAAKNARETWRTIIRRQNEDEVAQMLAEYNQNAAGDEAFE